MLFGVETIDIHFARSKRLILAKKGNVMTFLSQHVIESSRPKVNLRYLW